MTIETNTVLVYVSNIDDRYKRKEQLEHCKKAVKENNLPDIGRCIYEHDELSELIDHLRGSELVMLPRLSMLAENREREIGKRFLKNVIKVTTKAMAIMDVREGITTYDHNEWFDHIDVTYNKITNGRPMSSEAAKRVRKAKNPRGLEQYWKEHVKKNEPERFERLRLHWLNPTITAAQAIEQSPDDELKNAHRSMWERIFGGKTTGKKVR